MMTATEPAFSALLTIACLDEPTTSPDQDVSEAEPVTSISKQPDGDTGRSAKRNPWLPWM
jgi:hypothetical protein